MSNVTDLCLLSQCSKTVEVIVEKHINPYLCTKYAENCGFKEVSYHSGGNRAMQATVFLTAINYLDLEDFLEFFDNTAKPKFDKYSYGYCLMVKGEHDDIFEILKGG